MKPYRTPLVLPIDRIHRTRRLRAAQVRWLVATAVATFLLGCATLNNLGFAAVVAATLLTVVCVAMSTYYATKL